LSVDASELTLYPMCINCFTGDCKSSSVPIVYFYESVDGVYWILKEVSNEGADCRAYVNYCRIFPCLEFFYILFNKWNKI